jgi:hypothetical protein
MARGSQAIDWETLYGPHRHCRGYGKPCAQGYVVKNGTSRGQPRAWCKACEARVVLRYGTAYDGLEADPAIFETAVHALAEGHVLRATARIVMQYTTGGAVARERLHADTRGDLVSTFTKP